MKNLFPFIQNLYESVWKNKNVIKLNSTEIAAVGKLCKEIKSCCDIAESNIASLVLEQHLNIEFYRNMLSKVNQKRELINDISINKGELNLLDAYELGETFTIFQGFIWEEVAHNQKSQLFIQQAIQQVKLQHEQQNNESRLKATMECEDTSRLNLESWENSEREFLIKDELDKAEAII